MEKQFTVTDDLLASQGQRFINVLVDTIVYYALIVVLMIIVAVVAGILQANSVLQWLGNIGDGEAYLIFFAIFFLYYVTLETYTGRTVAKFLTKTMLVMEDGSKPTAGTIWKRTFCRLIPFDGFSYLGSARGWHDTIPDVLVVKKGAFERSRELFHAFEEIGGTNTTEA